MACPLTAEIAAELIRSGVARQVAEGRKREAEARSKIARESFPGWDFDCSAGANFLWLRLPEHSPSSEFAAPAQRRGVLVTPSDHFMAGPRQRAPAAPLSLATPPHRPTPPPAPAGLASQPPT